MSASSVFFELMGNTRNSDEIGGRLRLSFALFKSRQSTVSMSNLVTWSDGFFSVVTPVAFFLGIGVSVENCYNG